MRSFSQMIQNLKASESATYDAILETLAYIHAQYHAGRKVDGAGNEYWPQFIGAIQTKWLAEKIATLKPSGKPKGKMDVDDVALELAPEVSRIVNGRKEFNGEKRAAAQIKRAEKKESERKARVEAYEREQAEIASGAKFILDDNTCIIARGENAVVLTEDEFAMLCAHLEMYRRRNTERDVTPAEEAKQLKVA